MSDETTCIFCGAPTGSREHSFPASLGGRRTNKGILCFDCNEGFSDLDSLLSQQLNAINGFLGVRSDHADEPHKARITDPDTGTKIQVDAAGQPEYVNPVVVMDEEREGQRMMQMAFANERQVQEWYASMKAKGFKPKQVARGPAGQRFFAKAVPLQWSFGGVEAFREIGRIALNFLAHYFPALARSAALQPFKDYVLGKLAGNYVWYDHSSSGLTCKPSPFEFGHRIVISLDSTTGEACARLSFFSTFELSVRFGAIGADETACVVVDIDPLADHPPDDIVVQRLPEVLSVKDRVPGDDQSLGMELGAKLGDLLRRIQTRQWKFTEEQLLPVLNAVKGRSNLERERAVVQALSSQKQRILNLMTEAVEELKRAIRANAQFAPFADLLDGFVEADESAPSGLATQTLATLEIVLVRVAHKISEELASGPISGERLRLFLEGGPGAAVAGEVIMGFVMTALQGAALP